jgi:hypothetical protein
MNGIVEKIKAAPDRDTVLALLEEMKGYSFVSDKVSRKANKIARLRIKTLGQEAAAKAGAR